MRVLSIQQPWAYAITDLGKRIENRMWSTAYRGRFAIHATKPKNLEEFRFDLATCDRMSGMQISGAARDTHAQAKLYRQLEQQLVPMISKFEASIIAVADLFDVVTVSDSKWFVDGFGLVFGNVVKLREPVVCKGQLGLWEPDEVLLAKIMNRVDGLTKAHWELGEPDEGVMTICDNCAEEMAFNEQHACVSCESVLCFHCVEQNGGLICDECERVEESEVA
jgi:hypothetical protein